MRLGYVLASILLIAVSLICVVAAVLPVIQMTWGMGSFRFWCLVVLHVVTAVIASFCLDRSIRPKEDQQTEEDEDLEGPS